MRIGVLAARAGIPASRVRFYEAEGLLPPPPRRDSGYRDYDEAALADVRLIGHAQRLGYTLKDIANYLRLPHAEDRRAYLLGCVDGRLAQVDGELVALVDQRVSLQTLRRELREG
jgi:DNA-binding transcriptional MerR regulator